MFIFIDINFVMWFLMIIIDVLKKKDKEINKVVLFVVMGGVVLCFVFFVIVFCVCLYIKWCGCLCGFRNIV